MRWTLPNIITLARICLTPVIALLPVIGAVTEGEGVRVDGRRWPSGGHEHFR